jgi:exopolysaccharide biosynthesis polyprenyl glycosylphosphotransferase
MYRKYFQILLLIGDILFLCISLLITLRLRYGPDFIEASLSRHLNPFLFIFIFWIIVLYISEAYNLSSLFNNKYFFSAMSVNIGVAVGFFYVHPNLVISPKTNLAIFTILFILFFYLWRLFFSFTIDRLDIKQPVVFIGAGKYNLELSEKINVNIRHGYKVLGILCDKGFQLPGWVQEKGIVICHTLECIKKVIVENHVHHIIVSDNEIKDVYKDLYDLSHLNVRIYQLTTFWEMFTETIPIYSANEVWFLENLHKKQNQLYHAAKRLIDIMTAIALIPILSIPLVLFCVLVRLTSKGPVIFRQSRIGVNEKQFVLYKIRSMYQNAEQNGEQWAQKNDPRVTAIGQFMRSMRIDEIPQIFNVLKGDMSFVGPRPERPAFVELLKEKIPHYRLRHLVKPGLTGWAQVKYRYASSENDSAVKLMYDLYYIKNLSFIIDLRIALKTILTLLSRRGT